MKSPYLYVQFPGYWYEHHYLGRVVTSPFPLRIFTSSPDAWSSAGVRKRFQSRDIRPSREICNRIHGLPGNSYTPHPIARRGWVPYIISINHTRGHTMTNMLRNRRTKDWARLAMRAGLLMTDAKLWAAIQNQMR